MTLASRLARSITGWRAGSGRPLLVGLGGGQGSGKSTLAAAIVAALGETGLAAATLGLDDLYHSRRQRLALAASVHPLLATRGPPGTHDLARADALIDALLAGRGRVALPRFCKARDNLAPVSHWPLVAAPLDVLLLEGWCLGARPVPDPAPVNTLEALEDPQGRWRAHIHAALAGPYARLWRRLDRLVWLAAPDWPTICRWRAEQERRDNGRTMDVGELARFMMHYERITRAQLASPPPADLLVRLGPQREVLEILPG